MDSSSHPRRHRPKYYFCSTTFLLTITVLGLAIDILIQQSPKWCVVHSFSIQSSSIIPKHTLENNSSWRRNNILQCNHLLLYTYPHDHHRHRNNLIQLKNRMNEEEYYNDEYDVYEYSYPNSRNKRKIISNQEYELRNMKIEEGDGINDDDNEHQQQQQQDEDEEEDELQQRKIPRKRKRRIVNDYDDDYDDGQDEIYYDENEETQQESGNFWSNPIGGMDGMNSMNRGGSFPSSMKKKKRRKRGYDSILFEGSSNRRTLTFDDDDDDYYYYDDDDEYSRVPGRRTGSQRKTFRSGNPPPPNIMKELYNQLFWYGFDSDDTTSTNESRTMFGGTKGKFNGLGLLSDIQDAEQRKKNRMDDDEEEDYYDVDEDYYDYEQEEEWGRRRRTPRSQWVENEYDTTQDYDDDYYYYSDDEYEYDEYDSRRTPPRARNNDNRRREYQQRIKQRVFPQSMLQQDDYDVEEEEEQYSYIEIDFDEDNGSSDFNNNDRSQSTFVPADRSIPLSKSSSLLPPTPMNMENERSRKKGKRKSASSTSRSNDYLDQRSRKRRIGQKGYGRMGSNSRENSSRSTTSVASTWFNDEDDQENRRQEKKGGGNGNPSPIINLLDAVFQVDAEEVKYQADDYNRKLGLEDANKRQKSDYGYNDMGKSASKTTRRRKGYAYSYSIDEEYEVENGKDALLEEENSVNMNQSIQNKNEGDYIIDVEATVQNEGSKANEEEKQQMQRQQLQQQQSWEDRAQAYERVPPKNIKAWGPEGKIDGGIEIREYAARTALDEISKARRVFEKKEENVNLAENNLIQLKRDASALKKRLLSRDKRNRSSTIRDRLRMINFEIEDAARKLRQAKSEALVAIDKLEALEFQHWALLRQHEADYELKKKENEE